MINFPRPKPLVVVILDGWGISLDSRGNAIMEAATPVMDRLAREYPAAVIAASGLEVGLPAGVPGNSETGHRNIGAGRVEYQMMAHIDKAIETGDFLKNPALLGAIRHARENNSDLHLMGLVSDGGVHAHINHLRALMELLSQNKFKDRVYIHMFTDGRDAPPQSARSYLSQVQDAIGKSGIGKVASVTGRFYAMDRNKSWERTESTYLMLTGGERPPGASSADSAIAESWEHGVLDEMILPTAITRGGAPLAEIKANDAVIFFNFRPDRARQLTWAFTNPDKVGFSAPVIPNLYFCTLANIDPDLKIPWGFDEIKAETPLARVVADAGLRQLHIGETEKYAHITYYLSVGYEKPFPGEDRILVHSSHARNFADEPEMKAGEITDRILQEFLSNEYEVYFVNYANADMIGHSGDWGAAVKACAFVDSCLGQLEGAVKNLNGAMIVTADHGNAEEMIDLETGSVATDHTLNPVPFYYIREELMRTAKGREETQQILTNPVGVLADVAPTVLDILRLEKPSSMSGVSLLGSLR